jgi:hypothetical protein
VKKRPRWSNKLVPRECRPPVSDAVRRRLADTAPWWLKRVAALQRTEAARPAASTSSSPG